MKTLLMTILVSLNALADVPFDPNRLTLYTNQELNSVDPKTGDSLEDRISHYFKEPEKFSPSRENILKQRAHDAGIEDAMNQFLEIDATGKSKKFRIVSLMGSSSLTRSDLWFKRTALLSFKLSRAGFYVVSGGGAGLMEAAHLGSYMSKYEESDLLMALDTLAKTPLPPAGKKQFELPEFKEIALEVLQKFPTGVGTLGIPVWFMGHEKGNEFNGPVAKFLSNALREEKITSVGVDGAIFLPGGPGTMKEVFMTASNNNYRVYHWFSPMVFFNNSDSDATTMQNLVLKTATSYAPKKMTLISSDPDEVIRFLNDNPPSDKK